MPESEARKLYRVNSGSEAPLLSLKDIVIYRKQQDMTKV